MCHHGLVTNPVRCPLTQTRSALAATYGAHCEPLAIATPAGSTRSIGSNTVLSWNTRSATPLAQ